jgi:hypothetical protein
MLNHIGRLLAAPILLLAIGGTLAACSTGTAAAPSVATLATRAPAGAATPAPSAGDVDPEEAMLDFARCMREHGIDMPDPQFAEAGSGGGVAFRIGRPGGEDDGEQGTLIDLDSEAFQEAQQACNEHLQGVARDIDPEQRAELQEQLLNFARCMRDHGIDMPDPQFAEGPGGGSTVRIGGGPGEDPGFDPGSAEFQEAQEACQEELGELPFRAGPGPGGDQDGDADAAKPAS